MSSITACGVDPSITGTAICSGDRDGEFSIERFESSADDGTVHSRIRRYERLAFRITEHLESLKPDLILIEGYSFGSKSSRIVQMSEWGGILRWHMTELTPNIFEVPPTTLKKFITGKGVGQKEMMIAHVAKKWGHIFPTNDHVDAFCLWMLALKTANIIEPTNKAERDSIKTVLGQRTLTFESVSSVTDNPPPF